MCNKNNLKIYILFFILYLLFTGLLNEIYQVFLHKFINFN